MPEAEVLERETVSQPLENNQQPLRRHIGRSRLSR
jgi:hypothetical protein